MIDSDTFSAELAAAANTMLRRALGLPPQRFSSEQFIGMISEEIQQLRASGQTDGDIALLLEKGLGVRLDPDVIGRFYVDEAERTGYP